MNWRDTLRTATEAVRTHRLRSALTMLGILIGITAVVLTVGLGQGAQADGAGPDQRARHQPPRHLARAARPTAAGVRGGFGSASTLTDAGRRRARVAATPRPTSQAVAPVVDHVGVAGRTATRTGRRRSPGTTPSWADGAVAARSPTGGSSTRADEARGRGGRRARPRHRRPSCSAARIRSARPSPTTARRSRSSACSSRSARPRTTSNNDLAIVPLSTYAQRLVGGTNRNSVERDLREGDVGVDASRPRTRRSNALLLNLHGITSAADADFSIATAGVDPERRDLGRRHADGDARRHRGHLAARRRHRRDEHHARLGHRADPRDRAAQGARRPAPA